MGKWLKKKLTTIETSDLIAPSVFERCNETRQQLLFLLENSLFCFFA